jgi:hypothetical protein
MQLETRKCTTKNCSRTFRVLVSSKQTVCSNSCAQGPFPGASDEPSVKPPAEANLPADTEDDVSLDNVDISESEAE